MLLLYCMILSILESFITFFVLYNHITCNCDICDHTVIGVIILSYFITCVTITYNVTSHPLYIYIYIYFLLLSTIYNMGHDGRLQ